ncbi:hypothetical protein BD408DRAFT_424410 [Parasitella parasitica]|nr:hypothetical protein BD408DRAFT_424410 [Parasitella parasitica]
MSVKSEDPTKGLQAWELQRKEWTKPNQNYIDSQEKAAAIAEKYDAILKQEAQQKAIYKQLVNQRQIFKTPISLRYIIPILVSGWQDDGVWPKGQTVQDRSE